MSHANEYLPSDSTRRVWGMWDVWSYALVFSLGASIFFPLLLALVPGVFAISGVLIRKKTDGVWTVPDRTMMIWLGGLVCLCLASVLWAHNAPDTAERAGKVFALLLFSLPFISVCRVVPDHGIAIIKKALPYVLAVAGVVIAIEIFFDFPMYRPLSGEFERKLKPDMLNKHSGFFIMLLPFGFYFAWARNKRLALFILIEAALLLVVLTASQAAQLGFVMMILVAVAYRFLPKISIYAGFLAIFVVLYALPFVSGPAYKNYAADLNEEGSITYRASVPMRLENYDFLSKRILEKPLVGFGMDSTRSMTFDTHKFFFPSDQIMHPHNIVLQVWIEFGLIGVLFFTAFLVFLAKSMMDMSPKRRGLSLVVFFVVFVFLMVSWSIWASWLLGAMCVLAGLTFLQKDEDAPAH